MTASPVSCPQVIQYRKLSLKYYIIHVQHINVYVEHNTQQSKSCTRQRQQFTQRYYIFHNIII